ncbi:hypothetical protein AB0G54_11920 [Streptomyces yokosukanensis]|nr:hypothetical protein [Streptomyces yokosukanensis]
MYRTVVRPASVFTVPSTAGSDDGAAWAQKTATRIPDSPAGRKTG